MSQDKVKSDIAASIKDAPKATRSQKKQGGGDKGPRAFKDDDGAPPYDLTFPEGCPVEPLGINGDFVYFLDANRQLRTMKAKDLNRGTIITLFGNLQDLKATFWPRWSKPDEKTGRMTIQGWRPEQAGECLYQAAAEKGVIDVLDRVRGSGCWRDEDGHLVMHCGDIVYHGGNAVPPRPIGRHVYPSDSPRPRPSDAAGTAEAQELLSLLKSWNWRRPDVDPYLLLGWIGAAILGGALKWRPIIWITGDAATGKSTLHDVLKHVIGPTGMIAATDPTAAGLWQTVQHRSLPVALDELEAEADNRKVNAIIKLARHAASGGQTIRGGSDHNGSSFTIRSCFLFSSILIPPLRGQDLRRLGILNLDELPKGVSSPSLSPRRLAQIGAALRARMLHDWHRHDDLLNVWKRQLAATGHNGGGQDQFGTLMTCADMLLNDVEPTSDDLDEWGRLLGRDVMAETEGNLANHERCLSHLLTSQLDAFRHGERRTVGSWIIQAAGKHRDKNSVADIKEANRMLGNYGMKVMDKDVAGKMVAHFIIANDHQGLAELFRDTDWRGDSGTDGVWVQAMRRVKNAVPDQQRFNGMKVRGTAIPLFDILGDEDRGGGYDE